MVRRRKAATLVLLITYFGLILIISRSIVHAQATEQGESNPVGATQSNLPTVTPTFRVVTATPTPASVFVAAGLALEATANAATTGTATATPDFWVSATPTSTPLVVTNTPAPENDATATYQARFATAVALTTGTADPEQYVVTATDTPVISNQPVTTSQDEESADSPTPTIIPTVTLVPTKPAPKSPTPTPTPQILVEIQIGQLNPTPRPTPTYPAQLIGKILFQSRRTRLTIEGRAANVSFFAVDSDGSNMMALRPQWNWAYTRASVRDEYSADAQFRAFVKKEHDYKRRNQSYIFYDFYTYGSTKQLTFFGDSDSFPYTDAPPAHVNRDRLFGAWDPAWSPTDEKVAMVSNTTGNDEIWVVERDVWPALQLTQDDYGAWDRHPSWSPDGSQIVFFSTRSGNMQLWIMDADGSNQRQLTNLENEAWNPIWIKSPDS